MPQGFISGTVESSKGREAGVWVIAQTTQTPTPLTKIVVTGDDGRFVVPELPNVAFNVWVRGYGLVDSKPVPAKPGQTVNLKATLASSPAEAAKVYPANYWYSLLEVPAPSEFPGKGIDVNGLPATFQTQAQFIDQLKQGCQLCHQLGNPITRSLDHMKALNFKTSLEAWDHRVKTGSARLRDGQHDAAPRPARAEDVRRLDGQDRRRRAAAGAGASDRRRAERRHQHVGLGQLDVVHARRDHHLEAESARQRERAGLGGRRRARHVGDARSAREHDEGDPDPDARRPEDDALALPADDAEAVELLG